METGDKDTLIDPLNIKLHPRIYILVNSNSVLDANRARMGFGNGMARHQLVIKRQPLVVGGARVMLAHGDIHLSEL